MHMSYIETLQNYIIENSAMESVVADTVYYDNKELLKKKYPIVIFCTEYDSQRFYKRYLINMIKKYHYHDCIIFRITKLIQNLLDNEDIEIGWTYNTIRPELVSELTRDLRALNLTGADMTEVVCDKIMNVMKVFMKKHDILIGVFSRNVIDYTIPAFHDYPTIIINPSVLKLAATGIPRVIKESVKRYLVQNRQFDQVFGTNLNKHFVPIDPTKISLYHISKNPSIAYLEPRQTIKPINGFENTRIARISACDTVEKCIKAVNAKTHPGDWTVYKLILTPESVVGKPGTFYLPDVKETDEYWVLGRTKVKKIDTIVI